MTWWKAALGVLLVGLLAFGVYRWHSAVQRAEAADARADSAKAEAVEASEAREQALARLDSVEARERAVRDSLNRALAAAGEAANRSAAAVDTATLQVRAALDTLARRVGPSLEPVVARARAGLDSLTTAHGRYRTAMERRVRLLVADTASLTRELSEARTALDSALAEAQSWRGAYRDMESARDRWREAARLRLFGLPPEVTHAAAALAGGTAVWLTRD